jgi:hypothetical protein
MVQIEWKKYIVKIVIIKNYIELKIKNEELQTV